MLHCAIIVTDRRSASTRVVEVATVPPSKIFNSLKGGGDGVMLAANEESLKAAKVASAERSGKLIVLSADG